MLQQQQQHESVPQTAVKILEHILNLHPLGRVVVAVEVSQDQLPALRSRMQEHFDQLGIGIRTAVQPGRRQGRTP